MGNGGGGKGENEQRRNFCPVFILLLLLVLRQIGSSLLLLLLSSSPVSFRTTFFTFDSMARALIKSLRARGGGEAELVRGNFSSRLPSFLRSREGKNEEELFLEVVYKNLHFSSFLPLSPSARRSVRPSR